MNALAQLPVWAAALVSLLVLGSALLALLGSAGLLRLETFYQRVHAPTLGTTLGLYLMVGAALLALSMLRGRPPTHVVLLVVFTFLTAPITLLLLVRAALARDRAEGAPDIPAVPGTDGEDGPAASP